MAKLVPFGDNARHKRRMQAGVVALQKERATCVCVSQRVEYSRCPLGVRTVVERQAH